MLYVSTRLAVQRGDIVVFRYVVRHNDVVGQEEPNPIHVADVERMLKAFLLTSQPKVVLAGEVSPTKIDVLQTSSRVSPTTPDGQVFRGSKTADLNRASGAKRLAENSYEDAPSKRPASEGVQRPRNGRTIATPVHVSSSKAGWNSALFECLHQACYLLRDINAGSVQQSTNPQILHSFSSFGTICVQHSGRQTCTRWWC